MTLTQVTGKQVTDAQMKWLGDVENKITRSDLIGASRLLDAQRAMESDEPIVLIACSRLMILRGRLVQAQQLLDQALSIKPDNVDALVERARVAIRFGNDADAQEWFQRAWSTGARGDVWLIDWFDSLSRMGRGDDAINIAIILCEHFGADAGNWFRLGLAYQQTRRHAQALDAYQKALSLDTKLPMLRNNLGAAYLELNRYEEARQLFEATLAEDPDHAFAWTNLASVLLKTGKLNDSLVAAERACALAPNLVSALQTYSYVLRELQQFSAALEIAQRALTFNPENPSLIWTIAMLQLLLGDYENGWRNHEARWSGSPELRDVVPNIPAPRLNGEALKGKTIFVWGEQGHGDALQFVRFVPAVAEFVEQQGGKLVYCCFSSLQTLFARSLGDEVPTIIPHDQRPLPHFDFHLPVGSLPFLLGVTLNDLPDEPYLKADPQKVQTWSKYLPNDRKLRVGLAWSGSKTHQRNGLRSVDPLNYARAFAGMSNVTFVNLQMDAETDVQHLRGAGLTVANPAAEFSSFDDTAAVVSGLDLVITVCTSIAHLAGGLGVPTWVLLDVNPHWVWMTDRTDSPWYANTRLYRQSTYGDWTPVFEALTRDLAVLALSHETQVEQTENAMGSLH
ncbi:MULTISPECIES: tetratricopeptide repeat protein [unclassified Paraburkholderia]|uniref:tetratricopeptide repeat protein n=1 Tax=unclassified Paraburkholderia TaxID=2615204 RepID=UPI00179D68B1|nr:MULTISPECIES: tetratricopeptide repeat protein [unclassified Paraburkholderia]MBB5447691.1 tetratricopeptide (TPR) repeat protein [Paraburkholderia sp. WSM4177]MBB5488133.1 tetratricopeptide (TPR) repeat protein [Paraburkholderia sp. WSM4180]